MSSSRSRPQDQITNDAIRVLRIAPVHPPSQRKRARKRVPFHKTLSLRCGLSLAAKIAAVYFAKLATASASVLYTSNTVSSLVICSTSWNLLPRCASLSAAPCDFAL